MTNAELQALELQARIMGWAPDTMWDCIVEVPGPSKAREGYNARISGVEYHHCPYSYMTDRLNWSKWTQGWRLASLQLAKSDGLDHSEY